MIILVASVANHCHQIALLIGLWSPSAAGGLRSWFQWGPLFLCLVTVDCVRIAAMPCGAGKVKDKEGAKAAYSHCSFTADSKRITQAVAFCRSKLLNSETEDHKKMAE